MLYCIVFGYCCTDTVSLEPEIYILIYMRERLGFSVPKNNVLYLPRYIYLVKFSKVTVLVYN